MFAKIAESELLTALRIDNELIRTFLAVLIGMGFLMVTTIWPYNVDSRNVNGRGQKVWSTSSLKWVLVTFGLLVFVICTYYPGGFTLLRYYLATTRLGGETSAMLTVDSGVAKLWPEFFGSPAEHVRDVPVRSGKLKILLLGKGKLFVKPDTSEKAAVVGPLMIDRSRVQEIMFLPSPEHKVEVPASSVRN